MRSEKADPIDDFVWVTSGMSRSSRYVESQRFLECSNASFSTALAAFVRFAARFCFKDLADFLVMLCLGDLSDIAALCFWGPMSGPLFRKCTPLRATHLYASAATGPGSRQNVRNLLCSSALSSACPVFEED